MKHFSFVFVACVCIFVPSASKDSNCSSSMKCRCYVNFEGFLVADCSSSNLTIIPEFNSSVRIINLSKNRISSLQQSGKISIDVLKLNYSSNYIRELSHDAFQGMSEMKELDLSRNKLTYNSSVFKEHAFDDMKSLEYLNIKNNCQFTEDNCAYPRVIGKLGNLRQLLIDGITNACFSEEFRNLRKLESLDLSGHSGRCHIVHLRSGMFKNVPALWHLNLTNCNLKSIENGTFRDLISLRTLNLSDNTGLSFRIMENVTYDVQFTNITVLSLENIHCKYGLGTTLFLKDVGHLMNSNLQEIYLDRNKLENVQTGVLQNLPISLKFISVSENRFSWGKYLIESHQLKTLEKLDVSLQFSTHGISLRSFRDCNDWRGPQFSNDQSMSDSIDQEFYTDLSGQAKQDFNYNSGGPMPIRFHIPPFLKIVYGWTSSFHSTIGHFEILENNVTELHFQGNWFHYWQGPVKGLNSLKYLDLSSNMCSNVSSVFFDDVRNLSVLNVSNNNLGLVFENHVNSEGIFKNLVKLKYLDLSFNRIFSFPKLCLMNLTHLESLMFHHNLLNTWNIEISHMTKLNHLDISYNQIAVLNESLRMVIDGFVKLNNFTINMRGNILRCSCDDIEFLEWLYNKRRIFIDFTDYQCRLSNNTLLSASHLPVLLTKLYRDCSSYVGLIAGVVGAIVLSTCILIFGLFYRYRWRLRYMYYVTKSKYKAIDNKNGTEHKFELDAFVSYAKEEYPFIKIMIEKLETESGCKLCIHQRDFMPGLDIAENITNAIQKSRRTIIVLTNNYLSSYWCMFEFNMARMESIYKRDGEDVMFMILYQHVPPRDLPLPLMDLIQSNSYIEYPNDEQGEVVFWNKIKETITKD